MDTNDSPLNSVPKNEWDAIILSILTPLFPLCSRDALITPDDLQQEAWIGLLAACERYDARKARFTTYAYHYIRGHVMRYILRATRHKPHQIDEDARDLDNREYIETSMEKRDTMKTILEKISDQQHAHLLVQHFIHGKSFRGLAKEYGVSHETIATRVNRLLDLLEIRLNHENAFDH